MTQNWLAGLPPIPRDVLPRVVAGAPKGLTCCPRVLYREWVRSDGEVQSYVVYEIDPSDCKTPIGNGAACEDPATRAYAEWEGAEIAASMTPWLAERRERRKGMTDG